MNTVSPLRRAMYGVAAVFFVNGFVLASWLPRLPEIRDALDIDNGVLGLTLLGGGTGGIVGSLVLGRLFDHVPTRRVVQVSGVLLSALMPFIAVAPTALTLFVVFTLYGFLDVIVDVAMNAQAVTIQNRSGRSIINRMHGMWSLGGLVGAASGSLAAAVDLPLGVHFVVVAALLTTVLVLAQPTLVDDAPAADTDARSSTNTVWNRAAVAMAILALGAMAIEILPSEWSAVYLTDVLDAGGAAGVGLVAFSATMVLGRLGGDHVLEWVGADRLFAGSVAFSVVGAAVVVAAPVTAVAVVGYLVWGFGVSVLFPQIYATAANLPGTSAGVGLGGMTLGQRIGGLLTPVATGNLSEVVGLRTATTVVVVVALSAIVTARRVAPS